MVTVALPPATTGSPESSGPTAESLLVRSTARLLPARTACVELRSVNVPLGIPTETVNGSSAVTPAVPVVARLVFTRTAGAVTVRLCTASRNPAVLAVRLTVPVAPSTPAETKLKFVAPAIRVTSVEPSARVLAFGATRRISAFELVIRILTPP